VERLRSQVPIRQWVSSTIPDVAVQPTIAGIRAGRDEVLEAALKLAK
jgi:hypothetical protein